MDVFNEIFTGNASSIYISIVAVFLACIYYCFRNRSVPPGPTGIPYFGFFPFWDGQNPHLHLHELGKKYGEVFSFTVTGQLFINLGTMKVLREAHVTKSHCFSDRPERFMVLNMCFRDGVAFINGERWKVIRKFLSQQFRESGLNALKNEGDTIYETINGTIQDLYKTKGEPVDLIDMLTDKCTNILYTIFFGERGITTKEIREINDAYGQIFDFIDGKLFLLGGNIARYLILPFSGKYWKTKKYYNFMKKKLYEIIDRHKETFDEYHLRNMLDVYFNERRIRMSKGDPTAKYFTDKALMSTLLQIVGDGVISVAAIIAYYIQELVPRPEEQDKIYKELVEVIGMDRDPRIEDKSKLPYTNAYISEVSRLSNFVPFFPDMQCTKEVDINGYRIPKGAITIMNSWSINRDPNEYEDPDVFHPSRFFPEAGKKKAEQPMVFGLGKRACMGEGFVMSQVFLFLTTIVKHFHLSKPKDEGDGLMFLGTVIKVCATPRIK